MSAIEAILERELFASCTESHSRWYAETLLDASLEYWLMRHGCRHRHSYKTVDGMMDALNNDHWNKQRGWICDCLDLD